MNVPNAIIELLNEHKIPFTQSTHDPTPTSVLAARVRGVPIETGAKAMILRSNGTFLMCVLRASDTINFTLLKTLLRTKSLSFATREEVERITHCIPGGVPPFGNLFKIPVYCDEKLLTNDTINFNAGLQTVSISMNAQDWKRVVQPLVSHFTT